MHICPSPLLPYVQCQGSSPRPCAFWANAIPDLSSSPTQCFLMFCNILCHVSFLSNCTFIFLWLVKLYHAGWGGHFTHILRTMQMKQRTSKGEKPKPNIWKYYSLHEWRAGNEVGGRRSHWTQFAASAGLDGYLRSLAPSPHVGLQVHIAVPGFFMWVQGVLTQVLITLLMKPSS